MVYLYSCLTLQLVHNIYSLPNSLRGKYDYVHKYLSPPMFQLFNRYSYTQVAEIKFNSANR